MKTLLLTIAALGIAASQASASLSLYINENEGTEGPLVVTQTGFDTFDTTIAADNEKVEFKGVLSYDSWKAQTKAASLGATSAILYEPGDPKTISDVFGMKWEKSGNKTDGYIVTVEGFFISDGNPGFDAIATLYSQIPYIARFDEANGIAEISCPFDIKLNSAVPEPSTYIAGISAMAMLGLLGWKNRQ